MTPERIAELRKMADSWSSPHNHRFETDAVHEILDEIERLHGTLLNTLAAAVGIGKRQ